MRIKPTRRRPSHREPETGPDNASAALAEALAALEREGDIRGQESWLVGVRVGAVTRAIPPGTDLATCFACGSPMWVTRRYVEAMEARGLVVRPLCGAGCDGKTDEST